MQTKQLLLLAENKVILETFRYWIRSFFPDVLTLDTACYHERRMVSGHYDLCVPLLFSYNDIEAFCSWVNWSSTYDNLRSTVIAVLSPQLRSHAHRLAAVPFEVQCVPFTGCLAAIAQKLHLHTQTGFQMMVSEGEGKSITSREQEVLDWIASGASIKEISYAMGISPYTVITHKRNLYLKTGAHSMQQLALFALLHAMLPFDT